MTREIRATLLAATLLVGLGGAAEAAGRPDDKSAPAQGAAAGSATSVGAGGLTGSGATEAGARRTDGRAPAPAAERGGATAPAPGTTR